MRFAPYALIFLAFLVRWHSLTFQSLWRDEVDAICFAQAPLLKELPQTALSFTPTCPPNIPELLAAFTQPGFNGPLYFLILRGWMGVFGYSEFALRFFSLICGVISVAFIITLGTRWFNRAVGLIAAVLLTLSAYQVWYSQEAKMYTLITLLTLASIYFLRRAVEEGRLRFWIGKITKCIFCFQINNNRVIHNVLLLIFYLGLPVDFQFFGDFIAALSAALFLEIPHQIFISADFSTYSVNCCR
ncbi:MAG: phospholipid carrier-dependent glycosyltransferase [Chloroflexi bacterium]|nr:phospholipid carrier-dependent glycosyltransferase [Chloroflexota bacterium]